MGKGGGGKCSVGICPNTYTNAKNRGLNIRFFSFPKDSATRRAWVVKCNRKDKVNPDTARICSEHFTDEDYEDALKARFMGITPMKLRKTAVPSLLITPSKRKYNSPRKKRLEAKKRKEVINKLLAEYEPVEKPTLETIHLSTLPGETICCVANCKSNSKRAKPEDPVIRLFTFPDEPLLKEEWVKACGQKDNFDPQFKRVCSLHFQKGDYEDELQAQIMNDVPKKLKKGAYPSINLPSSEPGSTTSPVQSTQVKEKRNSGTLRKELVEECLKQYHEIVQVKNTTNKGKEKVSYLNTRELQSGTVKERKKYPVKLKKPLATDGVAQPKEKKTTSINAEAQSRPTEKKQTYTEKLKRLLGENHPQQSKEKASDNNAIQERVQLSHAKKRKRPPVKLKKPFVEDSTDDESFSDINEAVLSNPPEKITGYSEKLRKRKDEEVVSYVETDDVISYEENRCSNKNCQKQLKTLNDEIDSLRKIIINPMQNTVDLDYKLLLMEKEKQLKVLGEENISLRKLIIGHTQSKADLERKLALAQKELDSDSRFKDKAKERFKEFLSAGQVNVVLNKQTKTMWTQEDMSRAFSILYFSKQCYLHLRNKLHYPLPGLSTLRKWTSNMGKICSAENDALNQSNESENLLPDSNNGNETLNLGNQQQNIFDISSHTTSYEHLPAGEGLSDGSFNIADQQLNNFHSTQHIPTVTENQPNQEGTSNVNLNLEDKQTRNETTENISTSEEVNSKGKNSSDAKLECKRSLPIASKKFEFQSYLKNYLNKKKQAASQQDSTGKEKPYTCSICHLGFEKNIALQRHYKIHISKDPWKCDVCDKVFNTKFYLEKHILTHKGENNKFVCDICNRSFLKKNSFKDHYLLHKNLKPHEASKESPNKGEQCTAMYPDGNGPTSDKSTPNNSSLAATSYTLPVDHPYCCHVCNETFDDKNSLKTHLPVHGKRVKKVFEKLYTCATCSKKFKFYKYFKKHFHTCLKKKIFACKVCDKTFAHPGSVSRHMLLHDQQAWFFCEICNKGFKQRYYLTQHMRVHSGEKPFACEWCEMRFAQNSTLKKHIEAHKSGNYPNTTTHSKKKQVEMPSTSYPASNYPFNPNAKRNPVKMPSCASFPNTNYPIDPNLKRHTMEMPSSSYYYLT